LQRAHIHHAKRIGCKNIVRVFDIFRSEYFPFPTSHWRKLCIWYNGTNQAEAFWNEYLQTIKDNKPEMEESSMKLEKFYYWLKKNFSRDPKYYGVKFIQDAMNTYLDQTLDGEQFTIGQAFDNYNKYRVDPESPGHDENATELIWDGTEWYLAVDGGFGQKTRAVVEEFQRFKEIILDGIVGPQTFDSLMKENFKKFANMQTDWMRTE